MRSEDKTRASVEGCSRTARKQFYSMMDLDAKTLPPHVEGTVQAIAQLHAEHAKQASVAERAIDYATSMLGRPLFLGGLAVFVVFWIAINLILPLLDRPPFDPPPFAWL